MYLLGPANNRNAQGTNNVMSYVARYNNWSRGNTTASWLITLPDPTTSYDFPYEVGNPWGCAYLWDGFDVVGNDIFIAELWGPVHVFNASTGAAVSILSPGPEVAGSSAWEDSAMGLRAYQRLDGEYEVLTENSGYDGKCNLFRIPPGQITNFFTASYSGYSSGTASVGYEFTPTENISVTALGRSVSGSMNQNHTIYIWQVSNQALVASATVTPASPTDALGYKYTSFGTPVALSGGVTYRICSDERAGGDLWMTQGSVSGHLAVATISQAVAAGTLGVYPNGSYGDTETGFGVPTFYVGGRAQCATPTFTAAAGTYGAAQAITIACATSGTTIRYTTDGSTPSETHGTVYSTSVNISSTTTLQAIAYAGGFADSPVASGIYTVTSGWAFTNFFTASYTGTYSVTLSVGYEFTPTQNISVTALGRSVAGSMNQTHAIYIWQVSNQTLVASATVTPASPTDAYGYKYTTFGTPVALTGGVTYRICSDERAGGDPWMDQGNVSGHLGVAVISAAVYSWELGAYPGTSYGGADSGFGVPTFYLGSGSQCATPTFTAAPGSYGSAQSVTIACATSGTTIRYTTDGSTPGETHGTVYSTPVHISSTTTLQAIAYAAGFADSPVASGVYTFTNGWPFTNFFNASYTGTDSGTLSVGYEFTPTQNISVTALGRSVAGSMTQNHTIYIWQVSNQTLLTSATVTPASPTDALGYKYITFGTPVALTGGVTYRICSDENAGGDTWMFQGNVSGHLGVATISAAVYSPTLGAYPYMSYNGADSGFGVPTFYIGSGSQCATPSFSPVAGTYTAPQSVSITTTTGGATIRYTTDGSMPSETNGTVYSTPITICVTSTLQAIAYESGYIDSAVASGVYTIQITNFFTASYTGYSTSTASVGYEFTPTQNISVTALGRSVSVSMNQNHTIYIWQVSNQALVASATVTPASPTDALGYKYTTFGAPVALSGGVTYRICSDERAGGDLWMTQGSVSGHLAVATISQGVAAGTLGVYPNENYGGTETGFGVPTFYVGNGGQCATPTFTAAAGTYGSAQAVTIACATSGTTIRYTTDGSTPSEIHGTVYSTPVNISSTTTLQAIAYAGGFADSPVASGVYTFTSGWAFTNFFTASYTGTYYGTLSVGYEFTPTQNISVTALGRSVAGSMNQTHAIYIWQVSTQTLVASATVTPASPTDACGYKYTTFATPVALTGGVTYRICSDERAGGDLWMYQGNVSGHLGVAVISAAVYSWELGAYPGTSYGGTDSGFGVPTFYLGSGGQCATPTFISAPGTYGSAQTVTIACATSGTTIRYTTDGSTPNETHGTVYSTPVNISSTTTLQAIAYAGGFADSPVASGVYTFTNGWAFTNFFTASYTGTDSGTLSVGYEFTPTQNISVTALGRSVSGSMNQNHTIYIWQVSNQTLLTSATVTPSSLTDALGYKYITFGTPVALTGGVTYRICSDENAGGDAWMYQGNVSGHLGVATISAAVYSPTLGAYPYVSYNGADSGFGVPTFYVSGPCATPTFSPAAGTYTSPPSVSITTSTGGATIRYTMDGSTPSETNGTVYNAPVNIAANSTLKAIAYESGYIDSTVASGVYTIQCAAPSFNPAAGSYTSATVTISTTTSGANIRYTTNGTTPSSTVGTVYSSPVAISATETLMAIAYKTGLSNSAVSSAAYTIYIGTTTSGGTNTAITANEMRGTRFQAGSAITINHIMLDIGTSVSGNIQCAIYTDSSSKPSTFLMGTNTLNNPGTGWQTFTLTSSQALTSGTYYWLLFWSAANYSVQNTTASGSSWYRSLTYGSWPSSAGSGTTETRTWSIYGY